MKRIVVLGPGAVGKSWLLKWFMEQTQPEGAYMPTVEDEYECELETMQGNKRVVMLDTAGQEGFELLRREWFEKGDVFILCFALNDPGSYEEMRRYRKQLFDARTDALAVLCGCKCDLEHKVAKDYAEKQAMQWGIQYIETSGQTGDNVRQLFRMAADLIFPAGQGRAEKDDQGCCRFA